MKWLGLLAGGYTCYTICYIIGSTGWIKYFPPYPNLSVIALSILFSGAGMAIGKYLGTSESGKHV